ncbi:one cut domain family member 3 [Sarcoramphus papa]
MGFTQAFLIAMPEEEEGGSLGSGGQQASRFTGGKGLVFGRQPGNLQVGQGACKRKEQEQQKDRSLQPKKQRLVFTDLQRRTLIAIFKENKRPSKEMQMTISQQLGLELNTVSNFFMNARRRCMNRWQEEPGTNPGVPSSSTSTFSKA